MTLVGAIGFKPLHLGADFLCRGYRRLRSRRALRFKPLHRKVSIALRQIVVRNSGTNPSATALAGNGQG